jgi:predicted Ser/Thr protein kinase
MYLGRVSDGPIFKEDVLFGRALLAFKLTTRAVLDDCVREQHELARAGTRRTLAAIVVGRRIVTAEQYRRLVDEERRRAGPSSGTTPGGTLAPAPAPPPPRPRPQISMSGRYQALPVEEIRRELLLRDQAPDVADEPVAKPVAAPAGATPAASAAESGSDWEIVSDDDVAAEPVAPLPSSPRAASQAAFKKLLAGTERDRVDAGIRERLGVDPDAETFEFGPYTGLQFVAAGAAGVVYKARSPEGRVVALKALANLGADERSLRRFLLEAKAASDLDHPGIVKVHDLGILEEIPYMAMEFVEGRELSAILHHERPPREVMLVMVERVCDAVAYAHDKGIIHRDLKPANIMVRYADGAPLLTDFGLAKHANQNFGLTSAGSTLGTPLYTAPETIEDAQHSTALSDIYSLGVIVYQACCGRLPFVASSAPVLFELVRNGKLGVPSRIDPTSPRVLDAVCARALARSPEDRYQSARELGEALRKAREELGRIRPTGLLGKLGVIADKLRRS